MIFLLMFTFFVDYASFPYRGRIYKTEIYYQIPYNDLIYWVRNDSLISQYQIIIDVQSDKLKRSDTLSKTTFLESYKTAKRRDVSIIDQYGLFLLPGEYNYEVSLVCSSKVIELMGKISLNKIENKRLLLSDLELAVAAYPETTKTPFSKYGLTVIPNPSRNFGGQWKVIYPYFEIYNLKPDSNFYEVIYAIRNSKDKIVKKDVEKSQKIFSAQNEVIGIDLSGLDEDSYTLEVAIDDSSTSMTAQQTKPFRVVKTGIAVEISDQYGDLIQALLGESEYQRYLKLPPERKKDFVERFKSSEVFQRYRERVDYVNENFRVGKKRGIKTDRGRLYIKYGAPDEIVSKTFEEIKPIQHWFYYSNGIHFIFMDMIGDGDYQLLWSNSKDDPGYPNWERYLPTWAIEEY